MKIKEQKGYAILFAVVIVSVISVIAIGLSNTTYKQLILSSVAKDSQVSFFQADTAAECAIYAENIEQIKAPVSSWSCGLNEKGEPFVFDIEELSGGGYYAYPVFGTKKVATPCFDFSVQNLTAVNPNDPNIKISAKGYNSCDKKSPRTVEREIQVFY